MAERNYRDELAMLSKKMPTGEWGTLTLNQQLFKNSYAVAARQLLFIENFEGYNEVLALNDLPVISILIQCDVERALENNIRSMELFGEYIG